MTEKLKVQCCIAGGGPAGMMLGYLLGRAGIRAVVLEKHADFLRDFRGDTVHPSTLQIMQELGLLPDFLLQPHSRISAIAAEIEDRTFEIADLRRVPTPYRFIALMPQWDFLNFLRQKARGFPSLQVRMSAEVTSLVEVDGRIAGARARTAAGPRKCAARAAEVA